MITYHVTPQLELLRRVSIIFSSATINTYQVTSVHQALWIKSQLPGLHTRYFRVWPCTVHPPTPTPGPSVQSSLALLGLTALHLLPVTLYLLRLVPSVPLGCLTSSSKTGLTALPPRTLPHSPGEVKCPNAPWGTTSHPVSKHVNHQSPPLCELQGQGHILHPEHSRVSQ